MNGLRWMVGLVVLWSASCANATWESYEDSPTGSNTQWYGNGVSVWWTSKGIEKYQEQGLALLQQQYGAGIETSIPTVDDPSHVPPLSFSGAGDLVIVRPKGIQFDLKGGDNTIGMVVDFDTTVWLVDVMGLPKPCNATATIHSIAVVAVLVPGRDLAGHITLNVDPNHLTLNVSPPQILFAPECVGVEKQGLAFLMEQSLMDQLSAVLIGQPTFVAGLESVGSQMFGMAVTQRLRAVESRAPLGAGQLQVTLQAMSADGSEPVVLVSSNQVVIPLGAAVQMRASDCGTQETSVSPTPPSMAPPALALDELESDVVVALRMDLLEHLFAALGPTGMWCMNSGFDQTITLRLEDISSALANDVLSVFAGNEPVSIQAELRGAPPSIVWKENSEGDVVVDMSFPAVALSLFVRLWNVDWLLMHETVDVELTGYKVALESSGPLALRLVDGTVSVKSLDGVLDEQFAEQVVRAVSTDYLVLNLPELVPYRLSKGRVIRHGDFLLLQMDLDDKMLPTLTTQASAVHLDPVGDSMPPQNAGCSSTGVSRPPAGWICLCVLAVFAFIRRRFAYGVGSR
jgi:hypothetical protein